MEYVPKFIHFDHFIPVEYPFGVHWKHEYIQKSAKAIYDTYKEDIEEGTTIVFVARGTSGAMIAGAMLNELHYIDSSVSTCILIVRKDTDTSAHCPSLRGIGELQEARFIVVDDFMQSGKTIKAILEGLDNYFEIPLASNKKYDMLCVSNFLDIGVLEKNTCSNYRKWKGICSRFEYVVCCPKPD